MPKILYDIPYPVQQLIRNLEGALQGLPKAES